MAEEDLFAALFIRPPAYVYEALLSKTSIRLLEILPNSPGDPASIRCTIHAVDLDDDPLYAALSYTWGQPRTVFHVDKEPIKSDIPFMIYCDGKLVTVTKNCFNALMHLRIYADKDVINRPPESVKNMMQWEPYKGSKYIWIDAICINQEDNDEKSVQVAMMDRIYRQARSVYVWLGEHDDFVRPAAKAIHVLANCDPETAQKYSIFNKHAYEELGIEEITRQDWIAIYAFFHRSWFCRAWIAQEIARARRALVCCGTLIFFWDAIAAAAHFLNRSRWDGEMLNYGLQHTDTQSKRGRSLIAMDLEENLIYETMENYQAMMKIPFMAPYFRSFRPGILVSESSYKPWEIKQNDRVPGFNPIILILELADIRLKMTEIHDETGLLEDFTKFKRIEHKKEPLSVIMIKTYGTVATCLPDKVYAFLNLADEASWEGLHVDYRCNTEEIYEKASRAIIRHSKCLSVLSLRQDETWTKLKDLPSWVPDFSVSTRCTPLDTQSRTPWNASKGLQWTTIPEIHASGRLPVSGLHIDSIKFTADGHETAENLQLLQGFRTDSITKLELLWRTLTLNQFRTEHPAPLSCGKAYRQLVWAELRTIHLRMLLKSRGLPRYAKIFLELHESFEKLAQAWREHFMPSSQEEQFIERHQLVKEALAAISLAAMQGIMYQHDGDNPLEPYEVLRADLESYGVEDNDNNNFNKAEMIELEARIDMVSQQRRLARTEKERLGYGPLSAQIGDEVWLLGGGKVPYMLRKRENGTYTFVGEMYLHGFMHGEAMQGIKEDVRHIELI